MATPDAPPRGHSSSVQGPHSWVERPGHLGGPTSASWRPDLRSTPDPPLKAQGSWRWILWWCDRRMLGAKPSDGSRRRLEPPCRSPRPSCMTSGMATCCRATSVSPGTRACLDARKMNIIQELLSRKCLIHRLALQRDLTFQPSLRCAPLVDRGSARVTAIETRCTGRYSAFQLLCPASEKRDDGHGCLQRRSRRAASIRADSFPRGPTACGRDDSGWSDAGQRGLLSLPAESTLRCGASPLRVMGTACGVGKPGRPAVDGGVTCSSPNNHCCEKRIGDANCRQTHTIHEGHRNISVNNCFDCIARTSFENF